MMPNDARLIATTRLMAEINGSCRPHIISGITGNLPDGWRIAFLSAGPTFSEPRIAVSVAAEKMGSSGTITVGARIEIDAPHDHLKIADELARIMSEKIRKLRPPTVRMALDDGAIMPTRGTEGSSGYDLYAPADVLIRRGAIVVIHSGVRIDLPDATWEAQIRPRSSMSKRGMIVVLGTVDSDYRGVVGATVINLSREDQTVKRGERYAQMVLARVSHPEIEVVEASCRGGPGLTETARGEAGFGSTGR